MRTRTRAVVAGLGAALSAALLSAPATAGGVETVQVRDDCDPDDFVVEGRNLCAPGFGGSTSVDELIAALLGDKGARAMEDGRLLGWRNNPVVTSLDHGDSLRVTNRGGEFHTFSHVDELGGGCVDPLNEALGLPLVREQGNNCAMIEGDGAHRLDPGDTVRVRRGELTRGTHLFQCLIHPWMHTTVHVG